MTGRIVEVLWQDTVTRHGWTDRLVDTHPDIHSVGYVEKDDDEGIILLDGIDKVDGALSYSCSTFIPRSAIRKVTELARKR